MVDMSSVDFLDRFLGRFLPRAACDNTRLSFFRVAMWCVCTLVFERRRRSFSALSLFGKKLGLDTQKSCALFFRGRTLLPLPAHPPPHDEAWRVAGSNPYLRRRNGNKRMQSCSAPPDVDNFIRPCEQIEPAVSVTDQWRRLRTQARYFADHGPKRACWSALIMAASKDSLQIYLGALPARCVRATLF